jgi:hypothetical protein
MLLAFLQKIVNSGAKIHRQFGEGRGSVDICIKYQDKEYVIETKLYTSKAYSKGINQVYRYLDNNGEKEGWLVIFNRNLKKPWEEKIYFKTLNYKNKIIYVFGC